ncbi:MAG TPA: hypothetical protein VFS21_29030 [Roseiflexaceae bacterium]|nr:hypothetical protein [Roseiflexaceae bacterium]
MPSTQLLLERLDAIGRSLEGRPQALALLGLGSVGVERDRLDAYSDLDFFALVEEGAKEPFLDDLSWLSDVAPVAFAFRNTVDGYKLLFADGVFCEMAVFTLAELVQMPYAPGRIVWRRPGVPDTIAAPAQGLPAPSARSVEWLAGEALTNLYVGLGRLRRGEVLTAQRFIQHYAVDRLLELAPRFEQEQPAHRDPFAPERRVEQRLPEVARLLPLFVQGYDRSRESALAILDYLEQRVPVAPALAQAIRELAG